MVTAHTEKGQAMINGIYEYVQGENPYDEGTLLVEAIETEKSFKLKIIERHMRYSMYIDVLFGGKETVTINKKRCPHQINSGNGWFAVYPNRMGVPLPFVRVCEEDKPNER